MGARPAGVVFHLEFRDLAILHVFKIVIPGVALAGRKVAVGQLFCPILSVAAIVILDFLDLQRY
jgi:hypothetical protein